MNLRPYQRQAIDMLFSWLSSNAGNPCIVAPTGSGKSIILAEIIRRVMELWPASRILVLSHVKELLEQDADKIFAVWPGCPLGIFSAGLGKKVSSMPVTVAGIQSVRKCAEKFGSVDAVIVDECHLISHNEIGGYRTFLAKLKDVNPVMRIIGLTATPYRLGHGLITDKPAIFDALLEPVSVRQLISQGYLSPLRSKATEEELSVEGVAKRGGEFIAHDLAAKVNTPEANAFIADEVIRRAGNRKAWLFFCTGVDHARAMCEALRERGIEAAVVTGDIPQGERDRIIKDFREERIKALTNCDVLTTGFDYPGIDLIAMCRPTMSPGLYLQMAGRGLRTAPGKTDCLVLDFAGNVKRHGPITDVTPPKRKGRGTGDAPVKVCPQCSELLHASVRICPACRYEFPPAEKPAVKLHDDDIMGGGTRTAAVRAWRWSVRTSRAKGIKMLCVEYYPRELAADTITEYITLLHDGFARVRALKILASILEKCDLDVGDDVVRVAENLAELDEHRLEWLADVMTDRDPPIEIDVKKEGHYDRIIARRWKDIGACGTGPLYLDVPQNMAGREDNRHPEWRLA